MNSLRTLCFIGHKFDFIARVGSERWIWCLFSLTPRGVDSLEYLGGFTGILLDFFLRTKVVPAVAQGRVFHSLCPAQSASAPSHYKKRANQQRPRPKMAIFVPSPPFAAHSSARNASWSPLAKRERNSRRRVISLKKKKKKSHSLFFLQLDRLNGSVRSPVKRAVT